MTSSHVSEQEVEAVFAIARDVQKELHVKHAAHLVAHTPSGSSQASFSHGTTVRRFETETYPLSASEVPAELWEAAGGFMPTQQALLSAARRLSGRLQPAAHTAIHSQHMQEFAKCLFWWAWVCESLSLHTALLVAWARASSGRDHGVDDWQHALDNVFTEQFAQTPDAAVQPVLGLTGLHGPKQVHNRMCKQFSLLWLQTMQAVHDSRPTDPFVARDRVSAALREGVVAGITEAFCNVFAGSPSLAPDGALYPPDLTVRIKRLYEQVAGVDTDVVPAKRAGEEVASKHQATLPAAHARAMIKRTELPASEVTAPTQRVIVGGRPISRLALHRVLDRATVTERIALMLPSARSEVIVAKEEETPAAPSHASSPGSRASYAKPWRAVSNKRHDRWPPVLVSAAWQEEQRIQWEQHHHEEPQPGLILDAAHRTRTPLPLSNAAASALRHVPASVTRPSSSMSGTRQVAVKPLQPPKLDRVRTALQSGPLAEATPAQLLRPVLDVVGGKLASTGAQLPFLPGSILYYGDTSSLIKAPRALSAPITHSEMRRRATAEELDDSSGRVASPGGACLIGKDMGIFAASAATRAALLAEDVETRGWKLNLSRAQAEFALQFGSTDQHVADTALRLAFQAQAADETTSDLHSRTVALGTARPQSRQRSASNAPASTSSRQPSLSTTRVRATPDMKQGREPPASTTRAAHASPMSPGAKLGLPPVLSTLPSGSQAQLKLGQAAAPQPKHPAASASAVFLTACEVEAAEPRTAADAHIPRSASAGVLPARALLTRVLTPSQLLHAAAASPAPGVSGGQGLAQVLNGPAGSTMRDASNAAAAAVLTSAMGPRHPEAQQVTQTMSGLTPQRLPVSHSLSAAQLLRSERHRRQGGRHPGEALLSFGWPVRDLGEPVGLDTEAVPDVPLAHRAELLRVRGEAAERDRVARQTRRRAAARQTLSNITAEQATLRKKQRALFSSPERTAHLAQSLSDLRGKDYRSVRDQGKANNAPEGSALHASVSSPALRRAAALSRRVRATAAEGADPGLDSPDSDGASSASSLDSVLAELAQNLPRPSTRQLVMLLEDRQRGSDSDEEPSAVAKAQALSRAQAAAEAYSTRFMQRIGTQDTQLHRLRAQAGMATELAGSDRSPRARLEPAPGATQAAAASATAAAAACSQAATLPRTLQKSAQFLQQSRELRALHARRSDDRKARHALAAAKQAAASAGADAAAAARARAVANAGAARPRRFGESKAQAALEEGTQLSELQGLVASLGAPRIGAPTTGSGSPPDSSASGIKPTVYQASALGVVPKVSRKNLLTERIAAAKLADADIERSGKLALRVLRIQEDHVLANRRGKKQAVRQAAHARMLQHMRAHRQRESKLATEAGETGKGKDPARSEDEYDSAGSTISLVMDDRQLEEFEQDNVVWGASAAGHRTRAKRARHATLQQLDVHKAMAARAQQRQVTHELETLANTRERQVRTAQLRALQSGEGDDDGVAASLLDAMHRRQRLAFSLPEAAKRIGEAVPGGISTWAHQQQSNDMSDHRVSCEFKVGVVDVGILRRAVQRRRFREHLAQLQRQQAVDAMAALNGSADEGAAEDDVLEALSSMRAGGGRTLHLDAARNELRVGEAGGGGRRRRTPAASQDDITVQRALQDLYQQDKAPPLGSANSSVLAGTATHTAPPPRSDTPQQSAVSIVRAGVARLQKFAAAAHDAAATAEVIASGGNAATGRQRRAAQPGDGGDGTADSNGAGSPERSAAAPRAQLHFVSRRKLLAEAMAVVEAGV